MRASMEKFANVSGLNKLSGALKGAVGHAASFARSLISAVGPLGAITSAASVAGLYKLVSNWADFGTQLQNTSARMGTSAANLHTLQGAARLAGASGEDLASGLTHLGDLMQDAIAGRAPDAARLFNLLGINIRRSGFEAKSGTEVFEQVADSIARIKHPTIQAQVATQLFGGAAERLLPFLKRGAAGIREYQQMAAKYGTVNEEGVKQADRLRQAQTELAMSVEGLGWSIAEKLGPTLSPMITQLATWIAKNREWMATKVNEYVESFAKWVGEIDFKKITEQAGAFFTKADDIAQKIGGWQTAAEAFFALWLGAKFFGVMANVVALGRAVAGIVGGGAAAVAGAAGAAAGVGSGAAAAAGGGAVAGGAAAAAGGLLRFLPPIAGITTFGAIMRPSTTNAGEADELRRLGLHGPTIAENRVYDGLKARGLSDEEAAGVTSNVMAESGGNTAATNTAGGGAGAHGLFQWRGDRAAAFMRQYGYMPSSGTLDQQLDFFMQERNGAEKAAADKARAGTTAADIGKGYSQHFERHGNRNEDEARGQQAEKILQRQRQRQQEQPAAPAPQPAPEKPQNVSAVTAPQGNIRDVNGNIQVGINFANAPQGMLASATSTGDAFGGPPLVSMGMPSFVTA
ncbi:phage tail tip lysozyme, partial [Paracraurococcus lichenis]